WLGGGVAIGGVSCGGLGEEGDSNFYRRRRGGPSSSSSSSSSSYSSSSSSYSSSSCPRSAAAILAANSAGFLAFSRISSLSTKPFFQRPNRFSSSKNMPYLRPVWIDESMR